MKRFLLLFVSTCVILGFTACDDENDTIEIVEKVDGTKLPVNFFLSLSDENGINLLSESTDGNWLNAPISISRDGDTEMVDWTRFQPQALDPWLPRDQSSDFTSSTVNDLTKIIRSDGSEPLQHDMEMLDHYVIWSGFYTRESKHDIYITFIELNHVIHIEIGDELLKRESKDGFSYYCYIDGQGVSPVGSTLKVPIILPHRVSLTEGE